MQDYKLVIGGKLVEIPVVEIAAAEQGIVPKVDLPDMYAPKIRRMRAEAAKQGHTVADKAEKALGRARAKKKAKELLELAKQTAGPWRDWISKSLLKASRKDLLQKLQPGVQGKPGSNKWAWTVFLFFLTGFASFSKSSVLFF